MKPVYYDNILCSIIAHLGSLVISVDYRLSPEHPYPIPVQDCETVYRELVNNKFENYSIDPTKICIMGDSAGGNLSTVITQRQLRSGNVQPACQVLIYPVTHAYDFKSPSYQMFYKELRGTSLLNPRSMARWYLFYLGIPATKQNLKKVLSNRHIRREDRESEEFRQLFGREHLPADVCSEDESVDNKLLGSQIYDVNSNKKETEVAPDDEMCRLFSAHGFDADFSPMMGSNLQGLSPAMIITAGYDILRDEGILYAKKLQSFDVPVQWNHYPSAYHGVLNMPYSRQRDLIINDICDYIKRNML